MLSLWRSRHDSRSRHDHRQAGQARSVPRGVPSHHADGTRRGGLHRIRPGHRCRQRRQRTGAAARERRRHHREVGEPTRAQSAHAGGAHDRIPGAREGLRGECDVADFGAGVTPQVRCAHLRA